MHSVICIKQVPAPAQGRARFLSNTIVQRSVLTNRREAVAAEATPSSVTSRPERSPCTLSDRIHSSPDCGRCAPCAPKLRCCLSIPPLSMNRRYPRRTHARPRSRKSGAIWWDRCRLHWQVGHQWRHGRGRPRGRNIACFSLPNQLAAIVCLDLTSCRLAPSVKGPVLGENDPGCKPRATG